MGHYLSEMGDFPREPPYDNSGYAHRELIEDFYWPERPGTGSSCPLCGASIKWDWVSAIDLIKHIKWHELLKETINQGRAYPGTRI